MYGMISSDPDIYGDSGFDDPPYYGTAKAGVIQMTRYLARRLAHLKIRVNCISPGNFPKKTEGIPERPGYIVDLSKRTPMKRIGKPDEISGTIIFLASEASSYMTGQNVIVDGGWSVW